MKKKLIFCIIIVLFCAILFFVILGQEKSQNETPEIPPITQEDLPLVTIKPELDQTKPDEITQDYNVFSDSDNKIGSIKDHETVLIDYAYSFPKVNDKASADFSQNVTDYYKNKEQKLLMYFDLEGYDSALDRYNLDQANFISNSYEQEYIVSYADENIISVIRDEIIFSGGMSSTLNLYSETFSQDVGGLVLISDIISDTDVLIDYIYENLIKDSKSEYYDNVKELLVPCFKPENFYIEDNTLVIYYDMYDIAPYTSNVPIFKISFSDISDILTENYSYLGE